LPVYLLRFSVLIFWVSLPFCCVSACHTVVVPGSAPPVPACCLLDFCSLDTSAPFVLPPACRFCVLPAAVLRLGLPACLRRSAAVSGLPAVFCCLHHCWITVGCACRSAFHRFCLPAGPATFLLLLLYRLVCSFHLPPCVLPPACRSGFWIAGLLFCCRLRLPACRSACVFCRLWLVLDSGFCVFITGLDWLRSICLPCLPAGFSAPASFWDCHMVWILLVLRFWSACLPLTCCRSLLPGFCLPAWFLPGFCLRSLQLDTWISAADCCRFLLPACLPAALDACLLYNITTLLPADIWFGFHLLAVRFL